MRATLSPWPLPVELVAHRGVETSAHLVRIRHYRCAPSPQERARLRLLCRPDSTAPYITMLEGTAPLHDLGMIGLPEYIFMKPGKLSDEEPPDACARTRRW